jgi:UPF0176 protein
MSASVRVAAFYHFAPIADPAALAQALRLFGTERGLVGSIILATEGVNGTIAGEPQAVAELLDRLRAEPGLADLRAREHDAERLPFGRWKIKVKPEIVTMGVEVDAANSAGIRVAAADWNGLIADTGMILIDARNDYEVALGRFEGAVDPATRSFGDFPTWFDMHAEEWRAQGKRIAMYCTGGIRCEKSTAYARACGFDEVYHLEGGILAYLAEMDESASLWRGECFLFDDRVSITHGERPGKAALCPQCGQPLTVSGSHACFGRAGDGDADLR